MQVHPERGSRQTRSTASRRLPALPVRVRDAFGAALVREHVVTPTALETALDSVREGRASVVRDRDCAWLCRGARRLLASGEGDGTLRLTISAEVEPSPLAIRLVPERVARLHELVPVAVDDKTIRFLTATPYDVDAERDVSFATGRTPVVTLACRSTVQGALKRFYPEADARLRAPSGTGTAAPDSLRPHHRIP